MPKNNRGTSPNTRKAVAESNLRRKCDRIRTELATLSSEESDRLLRQSPTCLQVIFLLQEITATENPWTQRAEELAEELQTLLVEQAFEEVTYSYADLSDTA